MQYSHHCEHLLERLNKQREAGFLCDCTVVIGDFQFKAHRNVLASFSEYFGAIYRSTSENNVFLDQSQVKADGFQKLLEFIYTGTLNLDRQGFSVALEPVLELALVDPAGLELTEIRLPLPPKFWD